MKTITFETKWAIGDEVWMVMGQPAEAVRVRVAGLTVSCGQRLSEGRCELADPGDGATYTITYSHGRWLVGVEERQLGATREEAIAQYKEEQRKRTGFRDAPVYERVA